MQEDKICPKCGQMIPSDTSECPICANWLGFNLRRETLLLLCFILLGVLFVITGFVVKFYHAHEKALAEEWYQRGEARLAENKPQDAILDFRTALFHEGGNAHYQLRLAQALVASGHLEEARTYLMRLWQSDPASGPVNLELARLAMRRGDIPQVINYYHNAIDGVWQGVSEQQRRNLRESLCEYLIEHGRRAEAVAELMALSAETPDNPQLRTQVGDLYLKAQDYDSALKEFRRSLRLDRKQGAAWAGAGRAEFGMGNYRAARGYLTHALELDPKDADSARMLEMANRVLAIDPFERFVSTRVRRQRVIFAFQHALARMESCAQSRGENLNASTPQTDLQKLYASALKVKPKMREQILRRNPDLIDSAMALVFQTEQVIARQCGPPHGIDRALLLIAQKNGVAD